MARYTETASPCHAAADTPSLFQGEGRGEGVRWCENPFSHPQRPLERESLLVPPDAAVHSGSRTGQTCNPFDANCDSSVAGRDIAAFVGLLLGGSPPCSTCAGDADGSGGIDLADVPPLIDCLLTGNCPTVSIALCTPGDLTDNGQVTTEDIPPFVQVLLTGTGSAKEPCAADLSADGMLDGRDIQPFVDCLLNPGTCPPPPDGALPTSTDNTFYLHGAIVDQLAPAPSTGTPRLLLQYNRARYYDLRHARWLQRDPTGYVDGANLYEALHVNPARFTDPDGRYTKLYSTWNEGDEVLWQRMGWFGSVQDEFSVGKYYYLRGEKIVLYRRDIEGRGVLRPVVQGRGELGHRMNSASTCCKRSGSATDRTSCP